MQPYLSLKLYTKGVLYRFGVLDNSNIPKVLELLQTIKSKFRAVLIVSHIEEIKEVATRIVTIRDDGMESSVNC
jgi:DNA repair exonuclease SbcCD ATPase subunit